LEIFYGNKLAQEQLRITVRNFISMYIHCTSYAFIHVYGTSRLNTRAPISTFSIFKYEWHQILVKNLAI